jgi:HNH endonuclease
MKRGPRTSRTANLCACGCGEFAPIYCRKSGPRKGHIQRYAVFIPGHGYKDWGRRLKAMPLGARDLLPLGTTRLHHSTPTLVYRKIKVGPGRTGWRFEHRVVIERSLGRQLDWNEHVHHRNGDTLDNRIENLTLLSHSEHSQHHHALHQWSKKHSACIACNETSRAHAGHGLCTRCYQR